MNRTKILFGVTITSLLIGGAMLLRPTLAADFDLEPKTEENQRNDEYYCNHEGMGIHHKTYEEHQAWMDSQEGQEWRETHHNGCHGSSRRMGHHRRNR